MTCVTNCTVNVLCHNCTTKQLDDKIENITNELVLLPPISVPTNAQPKPTLSEKQSPKYLYPDKTLEFGKNLEPKQTITDTIPTESKAENNIPDADETTVPIDQKDSTHTLGLETTKTGVPDTTDKKV